MIIINVHGVVRFLLMFKFACVSNAAPTGKVDENVMDTMKSSVIDQRQSGDYNFHVNLKDIQIVALLGGRGDAYSDYDYNYDYSELTIKPQNTTSTTPIYFTNVSSTSVNVTTTTTSPNTTILATSTGTTTNSPAATKDGLERKNDTTHKEIDATTEMVVEITPAKREGIQSTTPFPVSNNVVIISQNSQSPESVTITTVTSPLEGSILVDEQTTKIKESNTTVVEQTHGGIVCQKGYMRNKKGECELRVKPSQGNTLRKLVELSQRLKLRKVR